MAAPNPTVGYRQGDSHTHLTLITAFCIQFYAFLFENVTKYKLNNDAFIHIFVWYIIYYVQHIYVYILFKEKIIDVFDYGFHQFMSLYYSTFTCLWTLSFFSNVMISFSLFSGCISFSITEMQEKCRNEKKLGTESLIKHSKTPMLVWKLWCQGVYNIK